MKEQLSVKDKKKIVRLVIVKQKSVTEVATIYGRDRATIHRIIKKHIKTGKTERRTKFKKRVKREIVRLVEEDPHISSKTIRSRVCKAVSISTINKHLVKYGFRCTNTKNPHRVI